MQKIVHICDICHNEFDPKVGMGGPGYRRLRKLSVELFAYEPDLDSVCEQRGRFDLCNDCAEKLLKLMKLWREDGDEECEWSERRKEFIKNNDVVGFFKGDLYDLH